MIRRLLVVAALVGFGAFAWSCNEDGSLSLEEYFEKVDELDDEQREKTEDVDRQLEALNEDSSADDLADLLERQVDLVLQFRDDLDDISPPDEVREAHRRVVETLGATADQAAGLVPELRGADSIEEAFSSIDEADFSESVKAANACVELEQIATENDIDLDLNCRETE